MVNVTQSSGPTDDFNNYGLLRATVETVGGAIDWPLRKETEDDAHLYNMMKDNDDDTVDEMEEAPNRGGLSTNFKYTPPPRVIEDHAVNNKSAQKKIVGC